MRNNVFDLDQDSTILSVLAVREPHRASRSPMHTLGVALLIGITAGLVILYLSGGTPWQ